MKPQLSTIKKSVLETGEKLTLYISTMERCKEDVPDIEFLEKSFPYFNKSKIACPMMAILDIFNIK
jgi:hypothetical protein